MNGKLRMTELFAGIGAQAQACEDLGLDFESIVCEIDDKAYKSYCAIHGDTPNLGDITKVERLPPADVVFYSWPCIRGDQRVHTARGLVPIKEVRVGDEVLTHMGRYKTVTAHAMTGIHGTVKIHTPISDLYCTKDHMIYTRFKIRPNGHKDEDGIVRRKFTPAYWAPAISLQGENYVGYVVNPNEIPLEWEGADVKGPHGMPIRRTALREHLNNEDFWWICGRYVADGWTFQSETQSARVSIAIGKGKDADIEKITKVFHATVTKERTATRCHICNTEFKEFVLKYFGHGASNKFIHQDVLNLPVHLLKAFLEGYISGDGNFNKEGQEWCCNSVSERLIRDLQQAIMKVYHMAPKYTFTKRPETTVIEGRTVNQKDTHTLRWHTEARKQDKMFYEDGIIWAPVKGVESLNPTQVYDISVEDDNSFVCEGMIVHNCQAVSIAGMQSGMKEGSGTTSSLLWEVIRLLKVAEEERNLPEYLCAENVYAVLNKRNKPELDRMISILEEMGYTVSYEILNAKDYGVPQNRKRFFMVASLHHGRFVFPAPCPDGRVLKDVLEPPEDVPEKCWLSKERIAKYEEHYERCQKAGNGFGWNPTDGSEVGKAVTTSADRQYSNMLIQCGVLNQPGHECINRVYDANGISPTVTTPSGGGHLPKIKWPAGTAKGFMEAHDGDGLVMARPTLARGTVQPQTAPTVTCGNTTGVCVKDPREAVKEALEGNLRIRYISPLEAWRLQGFSDEAYYKARAVPTSDTQLYKQAGNSIAVPCLTAIFKGMFIDETWEKEATKQVKLTEE